MTHWDYIHHNVVVSNDVGCDAIWFTIKAIYSSQLYQK